MSAAVVPKGNSGWNSLLRAGVMSTHDMRSDVGRDG